MFIHSLLEILQSDWLEFCDFTLEIVSMPVCLVVVTLNVGIFEGHIAGDASMLVLHRGFEDN